MQVHDCPAALCVRDARRHKGALLAAHLVHPELGGALLGGAALVALGNEPVGAWHQLGGAGGHIVADEHGPPTLQGALSPAGWAGR